MSREQSRTLKDVMEQVDGVDVHEKHGGKFRFRMYVTRQMRETSIEALDLTARSYNSLKRAGYGTVGELTDAILAGADIGRIRNCGTKSVREIKEKLFLLQYDCLPAERRERYLLETVGLNYGNICD